MIEKINEKIGLKKRKKEREKLKKSEQNEK